MRQLSIYLRAYTRSLLLLSSIGLTACTTTSTPYDYSTLLEAQPRSILIIPPSNHSISVDASYAYLSTLSKPLGERGYYVFPVAVIDQLMKENGLPTPAEMNLAPLDKIRKHTGTDAVLYVTIHEWGQKYQILTSKTVVSANLRLIDARTGTLLWQSKVYGERSSNSGGNNGLLEALITAAVDQIAGSITDYTPDVARMANRQSINSSSKGLLNGPYRPEENTH